MTLEDNVQVSFPVTTGHTVGDYWDFTAGNSFVIWTSNGGPDGGNIFLGDTRSEDEGQNWNTVNTICGTVGIGTTAPYGKLTVQGGTPDVGDLFNVNNANGYLIGRIYPDGGNNGVFHVLDSTGNVKIQLYSIGYSYFMGGNVGIGVTAPDTLLHLGGANAFLTIAETGNTPTVPATQDKARIYVKGDKLIIQFKDGANTRYKWLPLTGTGVSWQQSTIAP